MKKEPSKFREMISMSVPNFYDFNYDIEDFCGYYADTGNICPFIVADADPNREFKHIPNWDPQNCLWLCRWFLKQDLPRDAKRAQRVKK